jgi:hypothetical protein
MFSDTSDSMQFGHDFVLHQRVKEIAAKGFSTISAPKPGKKPPVSKIEPFVTMIRDAIGQQEEYLGGLVIRIHHMVRLMECLYEKDDKMAIATMQKIKTVQHEYVHVLRVIAGMKAYEMHIQLGLMGLKNVQKRLKEIETVPWNHKPSNAGKDSLVVMVEEKRYFPVMSSGGKIGFSSKPPELGSSETCSVSETFSATSSTPSTITASSSLASSRMSLS